MMKYLSPALVIEGALIFFWWWRAMWLISEGREHSKRFNYLLISLCILFALTGLTIILTYKP